MICQRIRSGLVPSRNQRPRAIKEPCHTMPIMPMVMITRLSEEGVVLYSAMSSSRPLRASSGFRDIKPPRESLAISCRVHSSCPQEHDVQEGPEGPELVFKPEGQGFQVIVWSWLHFRRGLM